MRYEFHPEALEEYHQAALWYAEREPELGLQFIGSVEDAIKRVVDALSRWRVIEEDIRRCLTRIFPYAVLYTIETDFYSLWRSCTVVASQATGSYESTRSDDSIGLSFSAKMDHLKPQLIDLLKKKQATELRTDYRPTRHSNS